MIRKRYRAIIHGRVQGVSFRDYTRREAERLGLSGWVRNLDDGTVETVFEGSSENTGKLLEWLEKGSPYSRVDSVVCHEEARGEDTVGFTIRL